MATWYVSNDSGNDSTGDGSEGSPYKSINKAASVATQGDTILVESSASGYGYTNGTDWGGFHIKGIDEPDLKNGTYAMIDGSGNTGRIDLDANGVTSTIENFYIKDSIPSITLFDYYSATGAVDFIFKRCIFDNISLAPNNNGRNGLIGRYSSGEPSVDSIDVLFENCSFINLYGGGWVAFPILTPTMTVTFRNSTFYFDSSITTPLDSIVKGSTNYDNYVYFYNCIIDNQQGTTLEVYDGADDDYLVIKNTCYRDLSKANADETANVEANPLFVDVTNNDFRLQTGSPARNIGDTSL